MTSVLDGVRVLDLSWGVAGPIAGMLLADHGADVVKVEPPGGDPFRGTPGYAAWLRGRRSVELDLHAPDDHASLPRARARRRRGARELRAGHDATARDRRDDAARRAIPASSTARSRRTAAIRPTRSRPGYDALGRRAARHHARAARALRRLDPAHERRRAVPARPRDPRGHGAGVAPLGSDLHLHAVAEHGHRLPRDDGHQRRLVRRDAHRPRAARRDVDAAGRAGDDGGEVAAVGAQRRARLPHVDHRPARDRRGCSACADGRWIAAVGAEPEVRALERRRRHARRCGATSTASATTPTACLADPENMVVLAHYFPEMAEAVARFPSDGVGARRGRGRRAAAAGAHAGRGARRPRAASPRARSSTSNIPSTERCARSGIVYGLSRTPGRVQGPVPPRSASTPTPSAPRPPRLRRAPMSRAERHRRADAGAPLEGITVLDLGFAVAGTVRHAGARRPRRQRHQGQRVPRPVVARQPHRVRRQPRQAQHRHRSQDPRRAGGAASPRRAGRRRALEHAARRARAASRSTRRRCARSTPTSSTATPAGSTVARAPTRRGTTRPGARSPASPTKTAASPTAAIRSGASRRWATPGTASSRRSA